MKDKGHRLAETYDLEPSERYGRRRETASGISEYNKNAIEAMKKEEA